MVEKCVYMSQKVEKSFCITITLPPYIVQNSLSYQQKHRIKIRHSSSWMGSLLFKDASLKSAMGVSLMQPHHCCILPALPPGVLWALHLF